MSKELALSAKTRGNTAFQSGDYETAIKEFTEAINQDPTDHIFYSNRSGAFASLKQWDKALEDANKCIEIKPDFIKGYGRKGTALFGLNNYKEAQQTFEAALEKDPSNTGIKEQLEEVKKAQSGPQSSPFGNIFGPDMWVKLQSDPTTRAYLSDPDYVRKLNELQQDPKSMNKHLGDPKIAASLGVLFGIGAQGFSDQNMNNNVNNNNSDEKNKFETKSGVSVEDDDNEEPAQKPAPKPAARPTQQTKPAQAAKKELSEADKAKELGNACYIKKNFTEALQHYNKAIELDGKSIVYYNNLAAVYAEQKEYDKAVETCYKGIEIGRDNGANFKDLAKAFFRIGNCMAAQGKLDEAIEAYNKSQVEDYSDKTKIALKKIEAIKKEQEAKAYVNPEKSEEAKQRGNEFFGQGKWVDAIVEYSDALRRDPSNYKVYSNRAACYTKLMDWQRGLDDCEACLKVDPQFVKAYIRKAKIQHFLKQYHKALETYDKGLQIDPTASELIDGRRQTMMAINQGGADPERAKEAMKDPEIQQILKDPTINKVLSDLQSNPALGQAALQDVDIRAKIEKLIAAGVLQVK